MTLMLIAGPAEEPVTLAEARSFLRLDGVEENALVTALITAARSTLEAETRRAFVTQGWRLVLDAWPGRDISLPLAPVAAVDAVHVDAGEGTVTLDPTLFDMDLGAEPPRMAARSDARLPRPAAGIGGIEIDFTAGYGTGAEVPESLRQATLMLVAHWFEARGPVAFGSSAADIPLTVAALVAPYRRLKL
ncbi:MAG: head-tail connector protein [Parvibaculum sp.]|uniref:head-tail connector protein n=1 Tax=Parvibaculum sp. TaxID=2024848 RepID=UPI003C74787D